MSTADTETRAWIYADRGRVADAVRILATRTTLAEHVTVHEGDPLEVEVTDDIPFALWGSGTQALWLLVVATAYSGDVVSLYATARKLDAGNSAAAADALAVLFGGTR